MARLLALLTALAGTALVPAAAHSASGDPAGVAPRSAAEQVFPDVTARRAAPMCQGKRATLVGRPGKPLRGTDKRDVVVTNGASSVSVGKGNDLVCVTGGRDVGVSAGPGKDRVVVRQRKGVSAVLGAGRDTFIGGPGDDHVYASGTTTETRDAHRDVIRTRGGDDLVVTGRLDTPNPDQVALGAGDDELWLYSTDNRGGILRGGTGEDRLVYMASRVPDRAAEWLIDAAAGVISDRGTKLTRFRGFNDYYLHSMHGASQHFVGTSSGESFTPAPTAVVSASMGGGDDAIEIYHFLSEPFRTAGAGLDGGPGRDQVVMQEVIHAVDADLATQRITVAPADPTWSYVVPLASIEDLALSSYETVTITGDDGPNRLSGWSCSTTLHGAGGDDVLKSSGFLEDEPCTKPATMDGGAGNDRLIGGGFDDHLDGGDGDDLANGRGGSDTCVAETRRNCES